MIKVLIVEDSRVASEYLKFILSNDPGIEVVGVVENGRQAVEFVRNNKPDLITMDIDMPVMNGLEATREIMSTTPVPIIVVTSSRNANEKQVSMEALSAGALSVIEKPYGGNHPKESSSTGKLLKMVKLMSEIKVVTHRQQKLPSVQKSPLLKEKKQVKKNLQEACVLAIGISTGGPSVLKHIFSRLTPDFPLPIVVVQHITEGFLDGLVSWLTGITKIPIRIASHQEKMKPGVVYFAPDNKQLEVTDQDMFRLKLRDTATQICPSVSVLFKSIADVYQNRAIALLLTGMGNDGAQELKELRRKGALTIAQDKDSSMVFGMPGVALKLDAADLFMNPNEICDFLDEVSIAQK